MPSGVEAAADRAGGLIEGEARNVADIDGLDTLLAGRRGKDATAPLCALQPPGQSADVLARPQDHARAQQHSGVAEHFDHGALPPAFWKPYLVGEPSSPV